MTINTGYTIADINALQAITADGRADGYMLVVKNDNNYGYAAIYVFLAANTSSSDGDTVVLPNDNPDKGRWIKTGWGSDIVVSSQKPQFAPTQSGRIWIHQGFGAKDIYASIDTRSVSDWVLISSHFSPWTLMAANSYTALMSEKILVVGAAGASSNIVFPSDPLIPGVQISIMLAAANTTTSIALSGQKYKGEVATSLNFSTQGLLLTLVYIDANTGWIGSPDNSVTPVA